MAKTDRFEREAARYLATKLADAAGYHVDRELRRVLDISNDSSISLGSAKAAEELILEAIEEDPASSANATVAMALEFLKIGRGNFGVSLWNLRPEVDHVFMLDDFLDVVTSGLIDGAAAVGKLRDLPDGVIHNFSILEDVRSLHIDDASGERFYFSGVALVRNDRHLAWVLVGGVPVGDRAKTTKLMREDLMRKFRRNVPDIGRNFEHLKKEVDSRQIGLLEGTEDLWRTTAWGIFNLDTLSHELRILGRGTNDLTMYACDNPALEKLDEGDAEVLSRHSALFAFADTAFKLPAYFAARVHLLREVKVNPMDRRRGRHLSKDDIRALSKFKVVKALDVVALGRKTTPATHVFSPPEFRVEVDGYYRKIAPTHVGQTPDGKPITGRTWVRKHVRWRSLPERTEPRTITVKSSVIGAIETARESAASNAGSLDITF